MSIWQRAKQRPWKLILTTAPVATKLSSSAEFVRVRGPGRASYREAALLLVDLSMSACKKGVPTEHVYTWYSVVVPNERDIRPYAILMRQL